MDTKIFYFNLIKICGYLHYFAILLKEVEVEQEAFEEEEEKEEEQKKDNEEVEEEG